MYNDVYNAVYIGLASLRQSVKIAFAGVALCYQKALAIIKGG